MTEYHIGINWLVERTHNGITNIHEISLSKIETIRFMVVLRIHCSIWCVILNWRILSAVVIFLHSFSFSFSFFIFYSIFQFVPQLYIDWWWWYRHTLHEWFLCVCVYKRAKIKFNFLEFFSVLPFQPSF